MTRVIDIRHWLDEKGDPHPRLRSQALQIARLIEYGGPLAVGHVRETLVECSRRPGRKPCPGLLWIVKTESGTLDALCYTCKGDHVVISGWQDTRWADGPMEPLSPIDLPRIAAAMKPKSTAKKKAPSVHLLKVTLAYIEPTVWRSFVVPSHITLDRLHLIIQSVMGWENCHLHAFQVGQKMYGNDPDSLDESKVPVSDVLPKKGSTATYIYDFGDDWLHKIVVEQISEPDPKIKYPSCVGGKRACPPEDCGGPPGYERLLEILDDPKHEEHQEMVGWLGKKFDADKLDLARVNRELQKVR